MIRTARVTKNPHAMNACNDNAAWNSHRFVDTWRRNNRAGIHALQPHTTWVLKNKCPPPTANVDKIGFKVEAGARFVHFDFGFHFNIRNRQSMRIVETQQHVRVQSRGQTHYFLQVNGENALRSWVWLRKRGRKKLQFTKCLF
jgi:hypothetical protein